MQNDDLDTVGQNQVILFQRTIGYKDENGKTGQKLTERKGKVKGDLLRAT